MKPYTRMVPRARSRIGEIELECVCGEWLPYPGDDGDDDKPTICSNCETAWHVLEPMLTDRAYARAQSQED